MSGDSIDVDVDVDGDVCLFVCFEEDRETRGRLKMFQSATGIFDLFIV
jgi:hypothetical protein